MSVEQRAAFNSALGELMSLKDEDEGKDNERMLTVAVGLASLVYGDLNRCADALERIATAQEQVVKLYGRSL